MLQSPRLATFLANEILDAPRKHISSIVHDALFKGRIIRILFEVM
jgi:hypothetical protein